MGGCAPREAAHHGRLPPAVRQTKSLRHELGVHQTTRARLDRQVLFAGRGALLFNALAHARDFLAPQGCVGREAIGRAPEIGQLFG